MSQTVIKVENLSKKYILGELGYGTLYHTVQSKVAKLLGKEDPNKQIGSHFLHSNEEFWALKDINFEIKQGERVGIIGRNGAGKSTLLKILSKVTSPSSGNIKIKGRVASLLEVGTGFHPELSGRDNIYLNGTILGMNKREIDKKIDEIIAFAEVEQFVDTPVKRYSSGMYVRLAFAVAAHLDPEILIVDEVLAVGDAAFQKKALGKMEDVSKGDGRTILFVSHNMGAVGKLCDKGILLDKGRMVFLGNMDITIEKYLNKNINNNSEVVFIDDENKKAQIVRVAVLNDKKEISNSIDWESYFYILIEYKIKKALNDVHVGLMIDKTDGTAVWHTADIDTGNFIKVKKIGHYKSIIKFPKNVLNIGQYQLRIGIAKYGGDIIDYKEPLTFAIIDKGTFIGMRPRGGLLLLKPQWLTNKIK